LQENFGNEWKKVYDGWVSEFTKGMAGIDNYIDALDKINDRRLKYLSGNTLGNSYSDFLMNEYYDIYDNDYRKHLLGVIDISKIVATQGDVDYFNILYRGYSRARLV